MNKIMVMILLVFLAVNPLAAMEAPRWTGTATGEELVLRPYRANLQGVKNELTAYRQMYLLMALWVMGGLAAAVAAR